MSPAVPPIGLAYVARSLLDAGHDVQLIDAVGEAPDRFVPIDDGLLYRGLGIDEVIKKIKPSGAIGVGVMFSQEWMVARKLLNVIHTVFPDTVIFVGGEHPTALPEAVLEGTPGVKYVLTGEGDRNSCELMEHLEGKRSIDEVSGVYYRDGQNIKKGTGGKIRIKEVNTIGWPAWHLVPLENYMSGGHSYGVNRGRSIPMMASRGCPYQCTFCSNPAMWTTRWVARDPEDVLKEIKHYIKIFQVENFDFHDLTVIVKKSWIIQFCKLLIQENLQITWQLPTGTRSEAIDEEVAYHLWKAGCRNLGYAPESGTEEILKKIKKIINKDRMIKSVQGCVKVGLNVKANFIVGFPGDRPRMYWETAVFLCRLAFVGLNDISVTAFSAYPGSALFIQFQKEGRLPKNLDDDYYRSLHHTDITKAISWTEHISSEDLSRIRNRLLLTFYIVSWTFRPQRFLKIIYHFIIGKEESRIDKVLAQMKNRLKKVKEYEGLSDSK
jgi:radical SAM superfamily enzyme YgiQ (UPF0313 family)